MKAINITRVDSYSLCVGKIEISISVVAAADDKGAPRGRPVTRGRGGGEEEARPAGLKKIYYICFENLLVRPCSNVKRISGTSNTVGHLITYERSHAAQLNRIFAVFVIVVHVLDEATLFI